MKWIVRRRYSSLIEKKWVYYFGAGVWGGLEACIKYHSYNDAMDIATQDPLVLSVQSWSIAYMEENPLPTLMIGAVYLCTS